MPTTTTAGESSVTKGSYELNWPELIPGILLKRYKRFLADIRLENGEIVTAHCPNSGRMTGCREPGRPVYISRHDSPKRKLKYTWELIHMPSTLVGVNTMVPNRLVAQSIEAGAVPPLNGYDALKREVRTGTSSRIDLMLSTSQGDECYVEVKNCTLVENNMAMFPDAVTARGKKHLVELQDLAASGSRCVMFFLVQRMDAHEFSPADHIDAAYGQELRMAVENGVEILVYDTLIDLQSIRLRNRLPYRL